MYILFKLSPRIWPNVQMHDAQNHSVHPKALYDTLFQDHRHQRRKSKWRLPVPVENFRNKARKRTVLSLLLCWSSSSSNICHIFTIMYLILIRQLTAGNFSLPPFKLVEMHRSYYYC